MFTYMFNFSVILGTLRDFEETSCLRQIDFSESARKCKIYVKVYLFIILMHHHHRSDSSKLTLQLYVMLFF